MPTERRPSIRLVVNGARDELIVDGHVFDRSGLSPHERREMTRTVKAALFPEPAHSAPRHRRRKAA